MIKPLCKPCDNRDYKTPAYATPEGYLCEKHWKQYLKNEKNGVSVQKYLGDRRTR